jgi:hypothetical protein
MTESTNAAVALRQNFQRAMADGRVGGAMVLQELSEYAYACIGSDSARGAVAFALGVIFEKHASDRDERPVTMSETYGLMVEAADHLSAAVNFVEEGGSAEDGIRIIAALAHLLPRCLYS